MASLVLGPAWSTDAEPLADSGRFPLGVETATLSNASRLVPLVNSGTAHARYYLLHAAVAATAPAGAGDAAGMEATRTRMRRAEVVQAAAALRHATLKPEEHNTALPYREPHAARAVEPVLVGSVLDLAALSQTYSRARNGFFAAYRGAEIESGLLDPRNGTVLPGPVQPAFSELTGVTSVLSASEQDRIDVAAIDRLLPAACLCQVRHGEEFRLLDQLLLDADHDVHGRGLPTPVRRARRRTAASAQLLLRALNGQPAVTAPAAALAGLCYQPRDELTALLGDELADWALRWRGALLRNASVTAWRWLWRWLTDRLPSSPHALADTLAGALVTGAGGDLTVADLLAGLPEHRVGDRLLDVENRLLHHDRAAGADPWDYLRVLALGARRLPEVDGPARAAFLEHGELSPTVVSAWLAEREGIRLSQLARDLTDLLLRQSEKISQVRIRWEGGRLRIPTRLRHVGDVLFLAGVEGNAEPGLRLERLRQLLEELGYLTLDGDVLAWGPPARRRWAA